ncbi:MAG: hypothetical protein QM802_20990 [Agriterribacter sp.]
MTKKFLTNPYTPGAEKPGFFVEDNWLSAIGRQLSAAKDPVGLLEDIPIGKHNQKPTGSIPCIVHYS